MLVDSAEYESRGKSCRISHGLGAADDNDVCTSPATSARFEDRL